MKLENGLTPLIDLQSLTSRELDPCMEYQGAGMLLASMTKFEAEDGDSCISEAVARAGAGTNSTEQEHLFISWSRRPDQGLECSYQAVSSQPASAPSLSIHHNTNCNLYIHHRSCDTKQAPVRQVVLFTNGNVQYALKTPGGNLMKKTSER